METAMAWQLLAIWVITIGTVVWFVRDERRLRAEARLAVAARYYAHAPKYRFGARNVPPQPVPPKPRTGSLLRSDRAYFDQLISQRARR
jgi:hypothetical protein